jgi:hypothetical protein
MFKHHHKKLVLCASTKHLLLGLWHGEQLQSYQTLINDEAGHQTFAALLQKNPTTPLYFIADAVAEDYRLERIPHVAGKVNNELIARKLGQFYRGLDCRAAQFISCEKNQRKEDLFLFVALNNDEFLQGWLAKIQAADAQLVGIYLLATLSQKLLKRLKITSPQIVSPHVLFCEKLSSGLRQTYLYNGSLQMSRLTQNVSDTACQWQDFCLAETEKTRLYLISQRFITAETTLNLVLANPIYSTKKMCLALGEEEGFVCIDANLTQLALSSNLSIDLIAQTPELLQMQLLTNRGVFTNLAPKRMTQQYQLSQIKRLIKWATVLLIVLGLSAATWIFMQGLAYKAVLNQALQDTVIQIQRYEEASKHYPKTSISAAHLKAAVKLNNTIASYPKSPKRLMQTLSLALAKSPNIQLVRLRWIFTSDVNINDDDKLLNIAGSDINSEQVVASENPYEIGFVTAEILKFNGDYQAALKSVNDFVGALQKDKNVAAVSVLRAPVNLSSFVDLHGNTADEQPVQQPSALFKLSVMLKTSDMLKVM